MHPKHKSGGLGTCPFHGRRPSEPYSISGDGEDGFDGKQEEDYAGGEDDPFWGNVGGETRRRSAPKEIFKLAAAEHEAGTVLCPAHPRYGGVGKGVCVYHGRAKAAKMESDDSVLRLRMS